METMNKLANNEKPFSPVLDSIYKLAIEEPALTTSEVLKRLGITQHAYKNFIENNMSLSQYRKVVLGTSRFISPEHREKILLNLKNPKGRPKKRIEDSAAPIQV